MILKLKKYKCLNDYIPNSNARLGIVHKKGLKMLPTVSREAKRQLHKWLAVCANRISLGGCKLAYLGVAIVRDPVSKWDRTLQNGMSHNAHSVISLCTNLNPNN
jgi:hypothetical protein